jgi:hypothetical protein
MDVWNNVCLSASFRFRPIKNKFGRGGNISAAHIVEFKNETFHLLLSRRLSFPPPAHQDLEMEKKAEHDTPGSRRRALTEQRKKDTASHLSLLGFTAQLMVELRQLYEDSLCEPMPDKVQDLLARLSRPAE